MQEQREAYGEKLDRLDRRLRTLYQCNSTFFQAESEQELLQSICEILTADGQIRLAWIGYCEDDAEKTVRPVAQAGYGLDYLERVRVSWGEEMETGNGPTGIAVRTGKACWIDDIQTDPMFSPWRAAALARGYASCIAVPLIAYGSPRGAENLHGTLNLYSAERNAFDESTVEHYTCLATSMAYAVTALRCRLAEELTHGVTTLRASDERKRAQKELRHSEAYLAEAQRLSHTCSFGWSVLSGEISWSDETFRIFEFDRATKPTVELILQRVHPEDVTLVKQTLDRASRDGKDWELEHRLLMPDGAVKYVHVVAHAVRDESGKLEFVGAVMDVTEQHHAKAALEKAFAEIKKSEDDLRIIIDTIPTLAWRTLPDGSAEYINQRWLNYTGLSAEEAAGWGWTVALHDEDSTNLMDKWRAAVATGEPFEAEARFRRADGKYRWFLARGVPLRDELGNIVRWYGTNTDIDDRKQAEEIRTAQVRHAGFRADVSAALSRPAPLGEILRGCAEAIVRHLDAAFARIWTLNKEENMLKLQASAGMYTHLDGPHSRVPIGKLKIGLIAEEKKPHLTNDVMNDPRVSDKHWAQNEGMVSFAGYPLIVEDSVVGVMAMFARKRLSAVTIDLLGSVADSIAQGIERKQTEEKVRQSEAYLAEAQRLSLTGSFGWNVSSGQLYWSAESFRIFGYDRAAKPTVEMVLQRVHPEDVVFVQETLARASRDGADLDFEHRLQMPDSAVKYVHVVAHAVRDESGKLEFVGAVMDVTERKLAEEVLRNTQADLAHVTRVTTLGELTASIAHEVNQPLTAIVTNGNASMRWLASQPPNLEEARQALVRTINEGHRAGEVIARIRALASKAPPQKSWLDINETILEVLALTRSQVQKHRIALETQLATDLPLILGDRIQLQQVLLNLILNAVEAMAGASESPRQLLVSASRDGTKGVLVAVRDSGPGLQAASPEQLFETFYTTKADGMGMGLSISRSIIEAHGGRLWATPNDGQGATFKFTLQACGMQE